MGRAGEGSRLRSGPCRQCPSWMLFDRGSQVTSLCLEAVQTGKDLRRYHTNVVGTSVEGQLRSESGSALEKVRLGSIWKIYLKEMIVCWGEGEGGGIRCERVRLYPAVEMCRESAIVPSKSNLRSLKPPPACPWASLL